ncbi:MAG: hypothetical protein JWN15_4303 [Firmicutes bacterium]|nr:hypothetical protein [Bacillota bacterium]
MATALHVLTEGLIVVVEGSDHGHRRVQALVQVVAFSGLHLEFLFQIGDLTIEPALARSAATVLDNVGVRGRLIVILVTPG